MPVTRSRPGLSGIVWLRTLAAAAGTPGQRLCDIRRQPGCLVTGRMPVTIQIAAASNVETASTPTHPS